MFWQLNADWEGAVARLVCNPQNTSGFWEKGYFKAKLGRQTVHFENGKLPSFQELALASFGRSFFKLISALVVVELFVVCFIEDGRSCCGLAYKDVYMYC